MSQSSVNAQQSFTSVIEHTCCMLLFFEFLTCLKFKLYHFITTYIPRCQLNKTLILRSSNEVITLMYGMFSTKD